MIEKDYDAGLTLTEILSMPLITKNAQTWIPEDVKKS